MDLSFLRLGPALCKLEVGESGRIDVCSTLGQKRIPRAICASQLFTPSLLFCSDIGHLFSFALMCILSISDGTDGQNET